MLATTAEPAANSSEADAAGAEPQEMGKFGRPRLKIRRGDEAAAHAYDAAVQDGRTSLKKHIMGNNPVTEVSTNMTAATLLN